MKPEVVRQWSTWHSNIVWNILTVAEYHMTHLSLTGIHPLRSIWGKSWKKWSIISTFGTWEKVCFFIDTVIFMLYITSICSCMYVHEGWQLYIYYFIFIISMLLQQHKMCGFCINFQKLKKCYQKLQRKQTVRKFNPGYVLVPTICPGVLLQLHLVMEG